MSDVIRIPLNHRKYALIDAKDAALAAPYRWYASYDGDRWVAARGERLGHGVGAPVRTVYLHRAILDAPPAMDVTFLNRDTLDCTKPHDVGSPALSILLAKSSEERTDVANEPRSDQSAVVFPAVSDFASSIESAGEPTSCDEM